MRILLASSTLDSAAGGLPVCVSRLAAALGTAGHDVTVVGQCTDATANLAAVAYGGTRVETIVRPWTIAGQATAAGAMTHFVRRWLHAGRPGRAAAVVHTHGVWTPAIIAAASSALREKTRLVISPHGMLRQESLRRNRLLKMAVWRATVRRQLAAADAVHVTSIAEAADLHGLLPRTAPLLVPWGVEPLPARPHNDDHAPPRVAAYLGRMLPIKGLDMLIDAWAAVRPEGWVLRMAGPCDEAMAAFLENRIAAHGLAGVVRLEPPIPHDNVSDFLSGADLFILPSRSENFGLAAGEALAAAVPVMTTTETAWTDVVGVGCGWCVPADTTSLITALRTAMSTPQTVLREMGHRGAAWVSRDFAWSAVAARLVNDAYTAS